MKTIVQLVLFFIIASSLSSVSYAIRFFFPNFTATTCSSGTLRCMGSVTSANGHLRLTPDTDNPPARGRIGRVLYPVSARVASFSTIFLVNMAPFRGVTPADGLTFIMAPNNGPSPTNSAGGYLGLSRGDLSGTFAVELDTFRNTWDIDANHVSVITRRVDAPLITRSLSPFGFNLRSGSNIYVFITYSNETRLLRILMGHNPIPLHLILSVSLDLSATFQRAVFVGFTASTGDFRGTHRILDWSFSSTGQQPLVDVGDDDDHRMGINNSTHEQPMRAEDMIISAT